MNQSLREGINIRGKLALRGCTPPSPLMETVHDFLMRIISEYYFSGPAEGKPCIFPFKFREFEIFFGCTTDFPADLPGFIVEVDTEQC